MMERTALEEGVDSRDAESVGLLIEPGALVEPEVPAAVSHHLFDPDLPENLKIIRMRLDDGARASLRKVSYDGTPLMVNV